MSVLNRSAPMISIAKVCIRVTTTAPMNGPIGWRSPPMMAMTRMLIDGPTAIVPGEIRPLNQTSRMPAAPAIRPASHHANTLCAVTLNPMARIRRGLSRIACRVRPKVERAP